MTEYARYGQPVVFIVRAIFQEINKVTLSSHQI